MTKVTSVYRCSACGREEVKWYGRCRGCGELNTFQEVASGAAPQGRGRLSVPAATFGDLGQVSAKVHERITTGICELDRVLGGGLVPGSYLVLAGEPGAGKSTLATQVLLSLRAAGRRVAYVSGEESERQTKLRFQRLGGPGAGEGIAFSTETSVERVCEAMEGMKLDLLVIDSIQTMFSEEVSAAPGSVSQIREAGHRLMAAAKRTETSVLLIGQVTKEGGMAGPRALEHMVDVVMSFEGDRREQLRVLRAVKNRFGNTDEIGVFEMRERGLVGVDDASKLLAPDRDVPLPGSAIACVIEGSRPVLVEVQALVNPNDQNPNPTREVVGLDRKRVQMLLAVLSRQLRMRLNSCDVFVKVTGGLKIGEPAVDLAVCLAIASAYEDRPLLPRVCAFGEVDLLGEIRDVTQSQRRAREAERLGYRVLDHSRSLKETLASALAPEQAAAATA
jgi:DNA repair protein RadA/Sms